MDKTTLLIYKWQGKKDTLDEQKQLATMAGASKKDIGAMEAYIKTFTLFINDLHKIKE